MIYNWNTKFSEKSCVINIPTHIDAVIKVIASDHHVTFNEIEKFWTFQGHYYLKEKTTCSRWIPYTSSYDQMKTSVKWCQKNLKILNWNASKHVYDIVTGDKIWIYSHEPDAKQQSTVWGFPDDSSLYLFHLSFLLL